MEWKKKFVDYEQTSILFEFKNGEDAKEVGKALSKAFFGKDGELSKLEGFVNNFTIIGRFLSVGTDSSEDDLLKIINFVGSIESESADSEEFEEYLEGISGELVIFFDEKEVPGKDRDKYYDALDDKALRRKLRELFKQGVAEDKAVYTVVEYVDSKNVNEDFSMGVSGPTGLNQGIPQGGPGKGVIPAPLFGKGKPVSRKEEDEKLKQALKVLAGYGAKVKKVSESAQEYTVDDVDQYLYHDLGFESEEVDSIISTNEELIKKLLAQGKNPAQICSDLKV